MIGSTIHASETEVWADEASELGIGASQGSEIGRQIVSNKMFCSYRFSSALPTYDRLESPSGWFMHAVGNVVLVQCLPVSYSTIMADLRIEAL